MITLNGDNPLTLECNIDSYTEAGATATDACEGDLSSSIVINASAVDISTPGDYSVNLQCQRLSGECGG